LKIPEKSTVTIDASKATFIDYDIFETIENFLSTASDDNIIIIDTINLRGKEKIQKHNPMVILNDRE
jgi:hypothetical protein